MTEITDQWAFDKAVKGLATQGFERCEVVVERFGFECRYNHGPRHCAAGWVFPEEMTRDKEGVPARLIANETEFEPIQYFLNHLQAAHDKAIDPEDMKSRLRELAAQYSLSLPEELL